jgi:hypothetical protein
MIFSAALPLLVRASALALAISSTVDLLPLAQP